jgi:serine/threonine protein kinase
MPASRLLNKKLDGGWTVIEMINPKPNATGGNFSVRYKVLNDNGEEAFLKALDFSHALQSADVTVALSEALDEYNFEKGVHELCKEHRMSRVVIPLDSGSVQTDIPGFHGKVFYIIFEKAKGDLRCDESRSNFGDLEWILRTLHQTAVGIRQLHTKHIAHQDLKPSNVLFFPESGSKISDLGRSSVKAMPFKWDNVVFPGDANYAPIEKLWRVRYDEFADRFSTDLYMLGSLFYYHFLDISATTAIRSKLEFIDFNFSSSTFLEALPYLREGFEQSLDDVRNHIESMGSSLAEDIILIIKELCEPDPKLRGKKDSRNIFDRCNLQRYVSKLDLLATKARMEANAKRN